MVLPSNLGDGALASVGVVAGVIVGKAAVAIMAAGLVLAGLGVAVAFVQAATGRISWSAFASTALLNGLSAIPALGAGRVAQIMNSRTLSATQALQAAGWAHIRGFTMGAWIFSW
jgi:siroheme synthase